jgi:AraC-like DNA-binding protein
MRSETEVAGSHEIFLQKEEITDHIAGAVIKILEYNIYSRLIINDICKELRYSRSYIFKQFKLATGQTVVSHFTKLKIDRAKQLIRENELNFTQISEKLMFDSPSYFYKTFKKTIGKTPKQYKSSHKS